MIGIFGGTFDPIHHGHLKTVQHVKDQLQLEQVRLVPLGQAVHRQQPEATTAERLEMLQAALTEYTDLLADDREIRRSGGSYTVDTLASLHEDFPDKTFCLITGVDAINHFAKWHKPEKILTLANIVVMHRPDESLSDNPQLQALLQNRLCADINEFSQNRTGQVMLLDVPQIRISSTQIRQRLKEHQDIEDLVPSEVAKLITQKQLYRQ